MNCHNRFPLSQGRQDEIREVVDIGGAGKQVERRPTERTPCFLRDSAREPSDCAVVCVACGEVAALPGKVKVEQRQFVVVGQSIEVLGEEFRVPADACALADGGLNVKTYSHGVLESRLH